MAEPPNLTPGAQLLLDAATQVRERFKHEQPGLNHLLLAALERHGPMAESLASGLNADALRAEVEQRLQAADIGEPLTPEALFSEAQGQAQALSKSKVSERDLAAVILRRAGWTLTGPPIALTTKTTAEQDEGSPEAATAATPAGKPAWSAATKRRTPLLDKLGRDLCRAAAEGRLPDVIGRDVELQAVMETLCRLTKRNPLLIGPAGVGKTAIVEGLAQRIVRGDAPEALRGSQIFLLQAAALIRDTGHRGGLEKLMEGLLAEARQEGVILFIDEIHTIVGSGGYPQLSDVSSLLKPALSRGEIACIGATTDSEFRAFIEDDQALARRFQPVRVQELSAEATLAILRQLHGRAGETKQIAFSALALEKIVLLAGQYLRNRHFPDKAIDIFEQCLANAEINGEKEVSPAQVDRVVERMVGVPVDLGMGLSRRLQAASEKLVEYAFCPADKAEQIVRRLEMTMRGLDILPERPNAVLMAVGSQGEIPELTGPVLAEALYGDRNRLIKVDMSRFKNPADVAWLTGAPPGYIGHERALEFHQQLSQKPWSVLHFENIENANRLVDEILAQAFRSGFFVDGRSRRIYLSDAIVLLTATVPDAKAGNQRPVGFAGERGRGGAGKEEAGQEEPELTGVVTGELRDQVDVAWRLARPGAAGLQTWVEMWALPPVAERYRRHGLQIEWDATILKYLADEIVQKGETVRAERLIEDQVLPLLIPYLDVPRKVVLSYVDGLVQVQAIEGDRS